jgi:hypothetical protein
MGKGQGISVLFFLVLFLSPLTFVEEDGCVPMDSMRELWGEVRKSWGDIVRTTHSPHE